VIPTSLASSSTEVMDTEQFSGCKESKKSSRNSVDNSASTKWLFEEVRQLLLNAK
jgi:hypothetical protein